MVATNIPTPTDDRRLHPWSWLFAAGQAAKGFVLPAVLVLFASGGNAYELWAAVLIVPIAASALLQYLVFRYRLEDEELVVRDGILTRTERHIPYARIQHLDLAQNPFHRLLRVALVRVETASGAKPEAVIRVLSLDAVDEMRSRVFAGRDGHPAGVAQRPDARDDANVLFAISASELVRLGIISNKGVVVVGATLGLFWQRSNWFRPDQEGLLGNILDVPSGWFAGATSGSTPNLVLTVLVVVVLAVGLLRVFSIAWFLVQLHGFRLQRRGDDLRAEYGLITQISRTIPPSRIQTLIVSESPLHRWFRRQSVELRMVGGGGDNLNAGGSGLDGTAPKATNRWLAPLIATRNVPALLSGVLAEIDIRNVTWNLIAPRAWRRIFRRQLLVAGCVIFPLSGLIGADALLALPPIAMLAYLHARLWVKHAGYALTPWGIAFKSGWWNRTIKIIRYGKIQTVVKADSPFDRRSGMASIRIDTAGAERGGYTIDIPYLDRVVANEVAERLGRESQTRAFRW